MGIGDIFLLSPLLLKGINKYHYSTCEHFWDVKMEICISEKPKSIATKI